MNSGDLPRVYDERGRILSEATWDNRHHITPSMFNQQNHTFYKVHILTNSH